MLNLTSEYFGALLKERARAADSDGHKDQNFQTNGRIWVRLSGERQWRPACKRPGCVRRKSGTHENLCVQCASQEARDALILAEQQASGSRNGLSTDDDDYRYDYDHYR